MDKCICNSCNNLKGIIDDTGQIKEYTCKYGFPSENCNECNEEDCSETCINYMEDTEETELKTVYCKLCGKGLEKVYNEETDGEVYCIDCYLKIE